MNISGIDYTGLFDWLKKEDLKSWSDVLSKSLPLNLNVSRWGDLPFWQSSLDELPTIKGTKYDVDSTVSITCNKNITTSEIEKIKSCLMNLHPWRKGPFSLFNIQIDSEWRSNLKWNRLSKHISSLKDKTVLDVGCGNGYYLHHMFKSGAKRVLGIDPSVKFVYQFYAIKKYIEGNIPIDILPLKDDDLPNNTDIFETVFSMGVLSHRKSPIKHLKNLKKMIKPGGQLVLETLVINDVGSKALEPNGRYAKMRNVWKVPTPNLLNEWLHDSGFINQKTIDISHTTVNEQRSTDWMKFESLADFLDPNDHTKTIEGYPAPTRIIITANSNRHL